MKKLACLTLASAALAGAILGRHNFAHAAAPAFPAARLSWGDQARRHLQKPHPQSRLLRPRRHPRGNDFYLVASDFHLRRHPGPALHGPGELADHRPGLQQTHHGAKYDPMQGYGEGTWAPTCVTTTASFISTSARPRTGSNVARQKSCRAVVRHRHRRHRRAWKIRALSGMTTARAIWCIPKPVPGR